MHRIDTARATDDGLFDPGNAGLGLLPTALDADYLNDLQENIAGVIEAAEIDLDKGVYTQLLDAIRVLVTEGLGNNGVPIGSIFAYTGNTAPAGFTFAGQTGVSRTGTLAALWVWVRDVSGNLAADHTAYLANPGMYGPGDGATTFDLPDPIFIRSLKGGRAIGSYQDDALQGFKINSGTLGADAPTNNVFSAGTADGGHGSVDMSPVTDAAYGTLRLANETRPKNVAYPFIIKI